MLHPLCLLILTIHAQKFPVLAAMCVHVTILIQRIQCFAKHPVGSCIKFLNTVLSFCIKFLEYCIRFMY